MLVRTEDRILKFWLFCYELGADVSHIIYETKVPVGKLQIAWIGERISIHL